MSLQLMARVGVSVLAVLAGSVVLGSQQQGPSQHAPGQAYTVRVQPCGEFGKPPCGTVVTIPAGATGASLYALAKQSVHAGRNWEAIIYIHQSAMMGYAPAETSLGADFTAGMEVPKDMVKGRYWLQKAADQGDGTAQACIGEMYAYAQGGPQDMAKAIHYYELAAAQHIPRGERNLGIDYELGYGVAHDRAKAISLLRRSAVDDRRIGQDPSKGTDYANALSRAGTRRFADPWELAAYVYPPPKRTQMQTRQSSVPAGCPAELNFSVAAYGSRAQFCSRHPGCPYQTNGMEQVCQRLPNGYGVN